MVTDLLHLVAPYIKTGLEDNEFCLWITEDNMEQEAMEALQRLLPEAAQYVSRKQLEILSGTHWYFSEGLFDAEKSEGGLRGAGEEFSGAQNNFRGDDRDPKLFGPETTK